MIQSIILTTPQEKATSRLKFEYTHCQPDFHGHFLEKQTGRNICNHCEHDTRKFENLCLLLSIIKHENLTPKDRDNGIVQLKIFEKQQEGVFETTLKMKLNSQESDFLK